MVDDRQTSDGVRFEKRQVGPVRLHLLGGRHHRHFNPVRRRRSAARKRRQGARADQAEADEPFLNDGHGGRVVSARDGRYP